MSQMNFLLTTKKNYLKHVATTIISIIENNLNYYLTFLGLIDETVKEYTRLKNMEKVYGVNFNIISITKDKNIYLKDVYSKNPAFICAYYRIFIFKLYLNLHMILYVIICNDYIFSLYNNDFGSKLIGKSLRLVPEVFLTFIDKLSLLRRL